MKALKLLVPLAAIAVAGFSACAQGTFQNLDFEAANIPASTSVGSMIPVSEALPAWSAYSISVTGTQPETQVYYDGISLGGPLISVIDISEPVFAPLQGKYSALLFDSVGISQTGVVPSGTESLLIDANVFSGPFKVTLGGQTIEMTPIEAFTHYTLYGGNIPSALAGQTETLSFIESPPTGFAPSELELDNVMFSPTSVTPEPNPLVLTGIGGLLFALYRRFVSGRP